MDDDALAFEENLVRSNVHNARRGAQRLINELTVVDHFLGVVPRTPA